MLLNVMKKMLINIGKGFAKNDKIVINEFIEKQKI